MASEELNRMTFERDLALRQAKLAKADLQVIQMALNENRPLEALRTVNNSIERLDEELDAFEELPNGNPERPRQDEDLKEGKVRTDALTRGRVDDWLWEEYGFGLEALEKEHVEGVSPESGEGVNDAG